MQMSVDSAIPANQELKNLMKQVEQERKQMNEMCDKIRDKVRLFKTKRAARMLESRFLERGDVRKLNSFIFE